MAPVVGGSNPLAHPTQCARSSAWIERQTPDLKVARSNRAGRTIIYCGGSGDPGPDRPSPRNPPSPPRSPGVNPGSLVCGGSRTQPNHPPACPRPPERRLSPQVNRDSLPTCSAPFPRASGGCATQPRGVLACAALCERFPSHPSLLDHKTSLVCLSFVDETPLRSYGLTMFPERSARGSRLLSAAFFVGRPTRQASSAQEKR